MNRGNGKAVPVDPTDTRLNASKQPLRTALKPQKLSKQPVAPCVDGLPHVMCLDTPTGATCKGRCTLCGFTRDYLSAWTDQKDWVGRELRELLPSLTAEVG